MEQDSPILGLGNDIIEIGRIQEAIDKQGNTFLERLFTPLEISYCYQFADFASHFAGRFAAKEAIAKALGTGFGALLQWQDIEILNCPSGKPLVTFSAKFEEKFKKSPSIFLSISHCKTYATAVAIYI